MMRGLHAVARRLGRGGATEAAVVRRAAWAFAMQTAIAVAAVVVLAAVLMYVSGIHIAAQRASEQTRAVATTADDVTDPPPGVVLIAQRPHGSVARSPNAPAGMSGVRPLSLSPGRGAVSLGRLRYTAYTSVRPGGLRMTALADPREHGEVGDRLETILLSGGFGIVAAGLVGWVIGRRAMRPVAEALALRRRFVADASHELRTPLAALHLRVQLLKRRLRGDDEAIRSQVTQLEADSRMLDEVLSDLLVSAELRHRPGRGETVELGDMAEEVVATMRPRADASAVCITVRVHAGVVVVGSRASLRRAALALVDNAVAHANGVVEIDVRRDHASAIVEVGDDGTGVDPGRLDELTLRFTRGHETGEGRRFGLGLALVREVVRAHGGELRAARRDRGGSVFTLVLPTRAADLDVG